MEQRDFDALVQRLVQSPHDVEAVAAAHRAGTKDPEAYASLLERVGEATTDPAVASHWLTEAASVWLTSLGDTHRAARLLMAAIDRDPAQDRPAENLATLYRDKGEMRALAALLERRIKALAPAAAADAGLRARVATMYEDLGRLWADPPLAAPKKAIDCFRRAIELEPRALYSIYAARELYKAAAKWGEALELYQAEHDAVDDAVRHVALYRDEAETRRLAADRAGASAALRRARAHDAADLGLAFELASSIVDRLADGDEVGADERAEAIEILVTLAESYDGEHALAYASAALDVDAGHERAMQLAAHFAAGLGRDEDVKPRWAAYLAVNPTGLLGEQARGALGEAAVASIPLPLRRPAAEQPQREAPTVVTPSPFGEAGDVPAMLAGAAAALQRGAAEEALGAYRAVLAIDPTQPEALAWLEEHLRHKRQYAELRDVLVAAARSPGGSFETRKAQLREVAGLCESHLRDVDGAAAAWKQILQLDRADGGARDHLRRLLERAGRWDELASVLEQEVLAESDPEAKVELEKRLAHLHAQRRGDKVAAGEAWARIAELLPGDDAPVLSAFELFEAAHRSDLAAEVVARSGPSIEDASARAAVYRRLAELRGAEGDAHGAGDAYASSVDAKWDDRVAEHAEQAFVKADRWVDAAGIVARRAERAGDAKARAAMAVRESSYFARAGDEPGALERLERAVGFDPTDEVVAASVERAYVAAGRHADAVALLERRARALEPGSARRALRLRAAEMQSRLGDADGARATLVAALEDGDDVGVVERLAADAEARGAFADALTYVAKLDALASEPGDRVRLALRGARLAADGLDDAAGAVARCEAILADLDPANVEAMDLLVRLAEVRGDDRELARALERRLAAADDDQERVALARRLASLREGALGDPRAAMAALEMVRAIDPEDLDAVARIEALAATLGLAEKQAEMLAVLMEFEGDDAELAALARKRAALLAGSLDRGDEALALLADAGDSGDPDARAQYAALGDRLGWRGVVASKLVEWNLPLAPSAARDAALRGAFERLAGVGRDAEAARLGVEIVRSGDPDAAFLTALESSSVRARDLDALAVAQEQLATGKPAGERAGELVRQAEVRVEAGVAAAEAIAHGELGVGIAPADECDALLARLAALAPDASSAIDVWERRVAHARTPAERAHASAAAAKAAAALGELDRARALLDGALAGAVSSDALASLEAMARELDARSGGTSVRGVLADALAAGGQAARDGGRTRGVLLRRAAELAQTDLHDTPRAFEWLAEALVAHADAEALDDLERLARSVGDLKRADAAMDRVLSEVFDGPIVRLVLGRRIELRKGDLRDARGAAEDLKRLHDLAPGDQAIASELEALLVSIGDHRGLVQLLEDQILRGRDPAARAELARRVAQLWDELGDPREAADAWRRVLRMKAGDAEAQEGLERAKAKIVERGPSAPPEAPPPAAEVAAPSSAEPAPAAGQATADATTTVPEREPPPERAPDASATPSPAQADEPPTVVGPAPDAPTVVVAVAAAIVTEEVATDEVSLDDTTQEDLVDVEHADADFVDVDDEVALVDDVTDAGQKKH